MNERDAERKVIVIGGSRIGRRSGAAYAAGQAAQRETPEQQVRRERDAWNKEVEAKKRAKKGDPQ